MTHARLGLPSTSWNKCMKLMKVSALRKKQVPDYSYVLIIKINLKTEGCGKTSCLLSYHRDTA
jgi:hypothetical protein